MPNHDYTDSRESISASEIPTLTEYYQPLPADGTPTDGLIDQLCGELQALLNRQLYQAMSATLNQLVNKQSEQMKDKIRSQLQQQLPAIIKIANTSSHPAARK